MASCHSTRREPALHERIIQQTILRQRGYGVLSLLAPWISTWPKNRLPSRHSLYRWSAWAALLEAGTRIGRCQIQKRLLFLVSTLLRYVLGRLSFWRRYAARGYWGHGRSRWGCCCYSLESSCATAWSRSVLLHRCASPPCPRRRKELTHGSPFGRRQRLPTR